MIYASANIFQAREPKNFQQGWGASMASILTQHSVNVSPKPQQKKKKNLDDHSQHQLSLLDDQWVTSRRGWTLGETRKHTQLLYMKGES